MQSAGEANAKLNLWHAEAEMRFWNADFGMPNKLFHWSAETRHFRLNNRRHKTYMRSNGKIGYPKSKPEI
jgi:hypothetical protein